MTDEIRDYSRTDEGSPLSSPAPEGAAPQPEGDGASTVTQQLLSWVEIVVIAVVLAWLLTTFVIVNARVPTGSMENTIMPGDRLIGSRLAYLNDDPERGDIVIFRYPLGEALGEKKNFIKRIIGLPGETVEIRDGLIYIDGSSEPLDEPYLKEEWTVLNDGFVFQVPEDSYLVLGDNRNNSSDSRYWASLAIQGFEEAGMEITHEEAWSYSYVGREYILGKALFRYWPLTSISKLS